ncbi:MAG: protein jag [Acidimicrobiales bacterium]
MEWIETTGTSIDEAKDLALDRLGVAEDELEIQVLTEPSSAMFGLKKTEARLRARVRPISPQIKTERNSKNNRDKNRKRSNQGRKNTNNKTNSEKSQKNNNQKNSKKTSEQLDDAKNSSKNKDNRPEKATKAKNNPRTRRDEMETEKMDLSTQAEITESFLAGLLEKMGLESRVTSTIEDERLTVEAHGLNLGLAIGHQGQTVRAITELSRTIIQRKSRGSASGSMTVDIGGYRALRQSNLEKFAKAQAEAVLSDGISRALDPMGAADRRVAHNAVSDIEGVETISEGSNMDRRVVIQLAE